MKELHIKLSETQGGQYQATILASPRGATGFALPTTPDWPCLLELSDHSTLTDSQSTLLSLQQEESANILSDIGTYLFNFLFGPPEKRNALYTYRMECLHQKSNKGGIRTVLQLDSPTLIGVPWELCNGGNDYLALPATPQQPYTLIRTAWEKGGRAPKTVPSPEPQEPLRVLLTICHIPEDTDVKGRDEALCIDQALFKLLPWVVDLHVLISPTLEEIHYWCAEWEPHVLHFVGHGGTEDVEGSTSSYLRLYQHDRNDTITIDQNEMMSLFGERVPRLVVLNACRSGLAGGASAAESMNAAKATQSFSEGLIQYGIQAVIAMQADIKGKDAVHLMHDFYRQLANGLPIDRALTIARIGARRAGLQGDMAKWAWVLPTLYLSKGIKAEKVLALKDTEVEPRVIPRSNDQHLSLPLSVGMKLQVGREKEQFQLKKMVLARDLSTTPSLILLHGIEGMGKTTTLYWLSEYCARSKRSFIYADFAKQPLSYWNMLRLIRDGGLEPTMGGVKLRNDLNPNRIFNEFNYALNCKLIKDYASTHPEPKYDDEVPDEAPESDPTVEMANQGTVGALENPLETLSNAFWKGLLRAAGEEEKGKGLIIFLDHIDMMSSETVSHEIQTYLLDRILTPNGPPPAHKIRLVLAVQDADPLIDSSFGQNTYARPWHFLLNAAPENEMQMYTLQFKGLPYEHEQLCWLAQLWARRYFISSASSTPFGKVLNSLKLQPEDIDKYAKDQISKYHTALPPAFLIRELLDIERFTYWLQGLGNGAS